MENIPKKIYLQIAETKEEFKKLDFNDLKNVHWCAERVFKTDIKYILPPDWKVLKEKFLKEFDKSEIITYSDLFEWFKNNISFEWFKANI